MVRGKDPDFSDSRRLSGVSVIPMINNVYYGGLNPDIYYEYALKRIIPLELVVFWMLWLALNEPVITGHVGTTASRTYPAQPGGKTAAVPVPAAHAQALP